VSEAKQIQRALKLSAALQTNKLKKRAGRLTAVAALVFIDEKRPWRVVLSASSLLVQNEYPTVVVAVVVVHEVRRTADGGRPTCTKNARCESAGIKVRIGPAKWYHLEEII
jgi:tRNA A58 N-methylase Trm61